MPRHVSQVEVAFLESLFDRSPDVAFFVKDAAGRYVAVNESLVARHGLKSKSQVIGKCPRDICPGDFGRSPTDRTRKFCALDVRWLTTSKCNGIDRTTQSGA